jgi:hypothetical protein
MWFYRGYLMEWLPGDGMGGGLGMAGNEAGRIRIRIRKGERRRGAYWDEVQP